MSKFSGLSTADLTRMIEYYAQKNVDLETSFLVLQITSGNKEKDLTQKYYDEKSLQTSRIAVIMPDLCVCAEYQRYRKGYRL